MQSETKLRLRKKLIEDACNTCKGRGCRDCSAKVHQVLLWSNTGIPEIYWDYSLTTFPGDPEFKKFVTDKTSKVLRMLIDGTSYAFHGTYGLGKTSGACEILKKAVVAGHTGYYTTMSEIVNNLMDRDTRYGFRHQLLHVDF